MYNETNIEHLYYKINNKHFKIPTHGRIYKIIDFGRAIYEYNDKIIENDSFSKSGSAYTQYNFGTFHDSNKVIIEPNKSFDLCRLSCSLFDFLFDDVSEIEEYKKIDIYDLILEWLHDDSGKNVLYKSNGEERYPNFKLYKMISRHVHKHIPEQQINHRCFEKYMVDEESMNMDETF